MKLKREFIPNYILNNYKISVQTNRKFTDL